MSAHFRQSAIARVEIPLAERSYRILIGPSVIHHGAEWTFDLVGDAAVIVTNETVAPLHLEQLQRAITGRFKRVIQVILEDGEARKDWNSLQAIFDKLLNEACDRKTVLFALGGGVIGDLTGFAAACYMRGVPFVQVPTTLLAQVDSSVGGKTAINHPLGKNMIGAFYQPRLVVCDVGTLRTLPDRELSSGLAEVIKYGPILDMAFFDWIEANLDRLLARDAEALTHAIRRSCELKAQVVGADERETGVRAILNFGHTFGHAIETGLGYGEWTHGEAVGCGMVMAARLSGRLGGRGIDAAFVDRLTRLIERARLPIRAPDLGVDRYLDLMRVDKKAEAGELRFVVLREPGAAELRSAPGEVVREVIEASLAS